MKYFTRYVQCRSIKILSLHYHELIGKTEEDHEGKKYFMVDDYMLDKVLDKVKEMIGIFRIGIETSKHFGTYQGLI